MNAQAPSPAPETNLRALLAGLSPRWNEGEYVFAQVPLGSPADPAAIVTVREAEGLTLVLPAARAQELGLPADYIAAWLTLGVHSALEAVGLTAAVSAALAEAGISANVVAGFSHDHVFVPSDRAAEAMDVLRALSSAEAGAASDDAQPR